MDSFGYKEVPEFTKELMTDHTKDQASVIDETMEILSEIAQEHANDEPDRENDKVSYYVIADLSTWARTARKGAGWSVLTVFLKQWKHFRLTGERCAVQR